MTKQIFINLRVKNLEKSVEFYTALGFSVYPLFTFDDQKCMAWGDNILLMLQSIEFHNGNGKKPLLNTKKYLSPSFTLPVESLENLNFMMENGLEKGGCEVGAISDEGFMQVRTLKDLDGYTWSIICLDIEKFKTMKAK